QSHIIVNATTNLFNGSELRRFADLNPSEPCLDRLDKLNFNEFIYRLHYDLSFYRFMCFVARVPTGTPEMVAYWLMKNWSTEAREGIYGTRPSTSSFATQVVGLKAGFPPRLRVVVVKFWARKAWQVNYSETNNGC
ncbi:hypothetical protein FOC4_g10013393, partial [Fusarium odoratissimum]